MTLFFKCKHPLLNPHPSEKSAKTETKRQAPFTYFSTVNHKP